MAVATSCPVFVKIPPSRIFKPYVYVIQINNQTYLTMKCLRVYKAGPGLIEKLLVPCMPDNACPSVEVQKRSGAVARDSSDSRLENLGSNPVLLRCVEPLGKLRLIYVRFRIVAVF